MQPLPDPHEDDQQQHLDDLGFAYRDDETGGEMTIRLHERRQKMSAAISVFLNLETAADEDLHTMLGIHFPGYYDPGTEFIVDAYDYWLNEREEYNDPADVAAAVMANDFVSSLDNEDAWQIYTNLRLYEQEQWLISEVAPFIKIATASVAEVIHQLYVMLEELQDKLMEAKS